MANLKNDLIPISDWIEFELETTLMDPPKIRVKIAHSSIDEIQDHLGQKKISAALREMIRDAIAYWDLQLEDKPLPCTAENKSKYLKFLVGIRVKAIDGKDQAVDTGKILDGLFGMAILNFAGNPENFLKN